MKKLFISAAFVLVSFAAITAQPRAIGLRLGYNYEASYQHSISDKGFLQADAGFIFGFRGTQLTATYNHILFTPEWGDYGEWAFSVGGGIGGGYYWYNNGTILGYNYGSYGWIGLVPIAQLSFKFEFPLQLSVDFRPNIGVDIAGKNTAFDLNNRKVRYHTEGLYDLALSVRYAF